MSTSQVAPGKPSCKILSAPTIVFLVFALGAGIGVLFARKPWGRRIGVWIGFLFWTFIAGLILYFLVKSCHSGWAWFVVVLYIIFNVGFLVAAFSKFTATVTRGPASF